MDAVLRSAEVAVITAHYGFLAYLIGGGFLAWRWYRSILVHVAAAVWAAIILSVASTCPLTAAQNWLRERRGAAPLEQGFIQHYVAGVVYPAGAERAVQLLVGAVVVLSWVGLARRVRRASPARART